MVKNRIKFYKYRKNIVYKFFKLLNELNNIGNLKIKNYKIIQLSKKLELLFFIEFKRKKINRITNRFLIDFIEKLINRNKLHILLYVIKYKIQFIKIKL